MYHVWLAPGFPSGSSNKEYSCNAVDTGGTGSIPGSGRCPGGGNDSPIQYSCWEVPWAEEAGGLQSMGVAKSQARLRIQASKPRKRSKFKIWSMISTECILLLHHCKVKICQVGDPLCCILPPRPSPCLPFTFTWLSFPTGWFPYSLFFQLSLYTTPQTDILPSFRWTPWELIAVLC